MRGITRLVAVLVLTLATFAALPAATAQSDVDGTANLTETPVGLADSTTATPTPTPTQSDGDGLHGVEDAASSTLDSPTETLDSTSTTLNSTTGETLNSTTSTLDTTVQTVTDGSETVDGLLDAAVRTLDDVIESTTQRTVDAVASVRTAGGDGDPSPTVGTVEGAEPSTAPSEDVAPALAAPVRSTPVPARTDPGPLAAGATAVAGVAAVTVGTTLGSGSGIERAVTNQVADGLERLMRLVAPLRYSRYDGSDPLEHADRATIHDYVEDHPGAYASAVSEAVDVPHSTVRHHLKVLEREGLVETAKVRGRRRLFPAHAQHQELAAALADEATAEILAAIARRGPCSGTTLAGEVDRSISTVSHHLSRLEGDGLVVREKDGRSTVNRLPADVRTALAPEQEAPDVDAPTVSAD